MKIAALAGLLSGAACATYFILLYANVQTSPMARFIDVWIPAFAMIFSMWYVRSARRDSHLHFWEGLMMGNITQLFTAIISASVIYFMLTYVNDAALKGYIEATQQWMIHSKENTVRVFGQKAYDMQLAQNLKLSARDLFIDELVKKIMYMFVLVPLISLILRKKVAQ
jgi:hypothetical protein